MNPQMEQIIRKSTNFLCRERRDFSRLGKLWPWFTSVSHCYILVMVAVVSRNHGFGFSLLFMAICIKGGILRPVQHRHKEISALTRHAGTAVDELQMRIQLGGPVTILAYRQAGFDEVSASPPNNRTGFPQPRAFSPGNQGSIAPMNAPMGQNEAVSVH